MDKEKQKKIEIRDKRNSLVVQGNDLARNVGNLRQSLSVQEQKLIIYLISCLCKDDKDFKTVKFNINQYLEVCNIEKSGRAYERVKETIKKLRDKSYWIKTEDEEILFAWLDTARMKKYETVEIVMSEALRPYLLDLREKFFSYELINILCLKSAYSIKLYEIAKSYLWLHKWEVNIDDFREKLMIGDKYKQFKELKRNVIDSSIREINKYTDISLKVETVKEGRSIKKLIIHIEEKRGVQLTLDLISNQEERLAIK